jgi:hypothetical protein
MQGGFCNLQPVQRAKNQRSRLHLERAAITAKRLGEVPSSSASAFTILLSHSFQQGKHHDPL